MDTQIPSPIPFVDFTLKYIPLPEGYPILPLSPLQYQPAAYTQGNEESIYVTILVPLPGQMFIELPHGIGYVKGVPNDTYTCELQLTNDIESELEGRLGILSFSISLSEGMKCQGQWEIAVLDPASGGGEENEGSLGKVVMDANILPTMDPKA